MGEVYLEATSSTVSLVMRKTGLGEATRVATVYLMNDGWHAKSADVHTRHAWSGPFVSPTEAMQSFVGPMTASA